MKQKQQEEQQLVIKRATIDKNNIFEESSKY
jgi:hypothetical protein